MLRSRGAGHSRLGGGTGTCRHTQPMQSLAARSRAAVWRFCARPGLLVLRVWPGGSERAGGCWLGLGSGDGWIGTIQEGGGPPTGDAWRGEGPETWRAGGVCLLCEAREEPRLLSLVPGDAAWWGGGAASCGFSPGCERGDNRGVGRPLLPPPGGRGSSGVPIV